MNDKIKMTILIMVFVLSSSYAQEGTKIPFKTGVVKICSNKKFNIKGYDGKEVIIRNLKPNNPNYRVRPSRGVKMTMTTKDGNTIVGRAPRVEVRRTDSVRVQYLPFSFEDEERAKGLKKIGKKAEAEESGIYLQIEQKEDELIIRDDTDNMFVMVNNEEYEISIPNSLKLDWNMSGCESSKHAYFFNSQASELKDFKGEVEISSTMNNVKLIDVSGPVSINTVGGNVTVVFNNVSPNKLYSIYSNNGFIDLSLPVNSGATIDAIGKEIMTDLDLTIVSEQEVNGAQEMKLKIGNGKVKMKLNADLGNIYLRKN